MKKYEIVKTHQGYDYIIIMKEKSKTITYQEFEKQLLKLLLKGETNEK